MPFEGVAISLNHLSTVFIHKQIQPLLFNFFFIKLLLKQSITSVLRSDLADPSDPGNLGLTRVGNLLLASFSEEEVNLVIIADGAVDALLQQHGAHEIRLCAHTQSSMSKQIPISSLESVSLETEEGAFK